MGGPDATPYLWKEPFSAVRASGGYPGNADNGLSPGRRQAIIRTNAWILLISEILIEILIFSFKKMRLKVSSAKRRPFCLGLNVLKQQHYPKPNDKAVKAVKFIFNEMRKYLWLVRYFESFFNDHNYHIHYPTKCRTVCKSTLKTNNATITIRN